MKNNLQNQDLSKTLKENVVVIIFSVLCIVGFAISGMSLPYVIEQVLIRLSENTFLVLALIIPVIAGMGLNFSMTVGAMAAQIAIFFVAHFAQQNIAIFQGLSGLFLAALFTTPIAALFGLLSGMILNKTKGQEMITGLILGFFATGLYMLFFLFFVGKIIPVENTVLILEGGVGVKNTFEVPARGVLNKLLMRPMIVAAPATAGSLILYYTSKINKKFFENKKMSANLAYIPFVVGLVLFFFYTLSYKTLAEGGNSILMWSSFLVTIASIIMSIDVHKKDKDNNANRNRLIVVVFLLLIMLAFQIIKMITFQDPATVKFFTSMMNIKVPMATYFVVGLLCIFNNIIQRTKLGQDIRTVGQSMPVATASGIHVNKVRIIAIVFSTIFAGWGQLIYLQSIGTVQTYAAHQNVALYSIAAILVGGASITKATNKQAIIGVILFHTMLIILPDATKFVFNDAQHSEYFRAFMLYGVICISLIMHAMETRKSEKAPAVAAAATKTE